MRTERTAAPDGVIRERHIHEECGVFGVFARETTDVASLAYYALYALQHRGQESAGIAVNDDGVFTAYRDVGLVSEVFPKERLQALGTGSIAVGHVRYGTTGSDNKRNVQPILVNHFKGRMALAHNGALTNAADLRSAFEMEGSIFHTTSDTEVITYIADYLLRRQGLTLEETAAVIAAPFWNTISQKSEEVQKKLTYLRTVFSSLLITGPFSIILGFEGGLMALNDRLKLRSMVVGEKGDRVYIASEEAAIRAMEPDAENIYAPAGGEPVIVRVKEGKY